jgi:hypothetical protein
LAYRAFGSARFEACYRNESVRQEAVPITKTRANGRFDARTDQFGRTTCVAIRRSLRDGKRFAFRDARWDSRERPVEKFFSVAKNPHGHAADMEFRNPLRYTVSRGAC